MVGIAGDPRGVSLEERSAWALEQYRRHGARLRADDVVSRLLGELRDYVAASREAMIAAGLVESCRICEEDEGGSCCGRGMEAHYDGVLLLVNLLLDSPIEKEWRDEESCLFLGPTGCCLPARDHICVNYLCMKLGERISEPALAEMRKRQGQQFKQRCIRIMFFGKPVHQFGQIVGLACPVQVLPQIAVGLDDFGLRDDVPSSSPGDQHISQHKQLYVTGFSAGRFADSFGQEPYLAVLRGKNRQQPVGFPEVCPA